jgi:glycosyltransferase involved in cell wall biosynthesis
VPQALPALITERTAIVHDWFAGYHGAERVVDEMRRSLFAPDNAPDIFTFHAARERLPAELADRIVAESRIAGLPFVREEGRFGGHWRWLLPYMPAYFAGLDLSEYDLVISSSHACALNARVARPALHVCYCYTPMRYAWLPDIDTRREERLRAVGVRLLRGWLREVDAAASRRPHRFIAISRAVQERIRRFYGRSAPVVHPPVSIDRFRSADKEPGLFIWVQRLVGYKRPELVMEAFRDLPFRLVMVGVGPLRASLEARRPPNVELTGWLEQDELDRLFERASGFIHLAEEDFGISMVEALAAGTPVLGLARGGATDIVRPELDGLLLEDTRPDSVRSAIIALADREWDRLELRERATCFAPERFRDAFLGHVNELIRARTSA